MRVLAVTNLFPNPWEPRRAPFNRQQLRALAEQHAVRVIAPVAWTREVAAVLRGGKEMPGGRTYVRDGIVVDHPRYAFTPKVMRQWYGEFYLRSVRRRFREIVAEFKPDVVLGCWAYPDGWAAVRLAREAGLPVVIKVHGSDVLGLKGQRRLSAADALRAADAVVAVSSHLSAAVLRLGVDGKRVEVVYNGVDAKLFAPGDRKDARRRLGLDLDKQLLLSVGNLVPGKGLEILIRACERLARGGGDFNCLIVGDGPTKGALNARIRTAGLTDRVRLVGPRPLEQLPDWYRAADLFALPSFSEGVPNVLLEAKACGCPLVATRVGGIPEIAPQACLVGAGDAVELAERIAAVLADPENFVARGNETVSWRDSARSLAGVLENVMRKTRAAAGGMMGVA